MAWHFVGFSEHCWEKKICKKLKVKYAVAVSSATAGLHMVNNLFKNKKFITSPLTFASTVSTVILSSNKIDLIDIDKNSLLIDTKKDIVLLLMINYLE